MLKDLSRRDFIKSAAISFVALNSLGILPEKVFAADNLSVKTRYGTFNGFIDEKGVKTWLGIPFAQPPVGKLRWRAPQPLKPSDKTFDAKKYGDSPMQAPIKTSELLDSFDDTTQSENCLTLNIFTRGNGKNKPVMVWIYGGDFVGGYSSENLYSGSNFAAANDVVIVFPNYRLNVFGFLNLSGVDSSLEDSGYLGNKDQFAALQWIKENIAEFGGNPENITVFGESAGSMSTMLLTVAPAAKNLFQKAISQSGHVGFYSEPEFSAQVAENFMHFSGAKTVNDLMKKSAAELQQIYVKSLRDRQNTNMTEFFPTCDGKFFPRDPFEALKSGAARGIKLLTGTTSDEWKTFLMGDEDFFKLFRENPKDISAVLRRYAKNPLEVYKKWLNGRPDTENNFAEFTNQLDWRVGQEIAAEYQSAFNDVYFYLFSEKFPDERFGSGHALDLPYTFDTSFHGLEPNPKLVKAMQAAWGAFAATGNPDSEFIPHWEKYSAKNRQTMELNSDGCVLHKNLNADNLNSLRYVYEN